MSNHANRRDILKLMSIGGVAFASGLSPLHDRFPGKMVHEAALEAQQLTEEKAILR